jgi:hypothetical protein
MIVSKLQKFPSKKHLISILLRQKKSKPWTYLSSFVFWVFFGKEETTFDLGIRRLGSHVKREYKALYT